MLTFHRRLLFSLLAIGGFPFAGFFPDFRAFGFLGGMNLQATLLLTYVSFLALAMLTVRWPPPGFKKETAIIVLFLLFSAVSVLWSANVVEATRGLIKIAAPFMMLSLAYSVGRQSDAYDRARVLTILLVLSVILLAVVNVFSGGVLHPLKGTVTHWGWSSLQAPGMSSADFSFLVLVGTILIAIQCIERRLRVVSLIILGVLILALVWAFVRITFLAAIMAVGALLLIMTRGGMRKIAIFSAIALFAIMGAFSDAFQSRMFYDHRVYGTLDFLQSPLAAMQHIDTSGRLTLWLNALDYFSPHNALIGSGVGAIERWIEDSGLRSELHSEYLRLYIELGIVGLLLYVWIHLQLLGSLYKVAGGADRKVRSQNVTGIALVIAYLVTLLTDNSLNYVSGFGFYVYAFVGLALGRASRQRRAHSPRFKESEHPRNSSNVCR